MRAIRRAKMSALGLVLLLAIPVTVAVLAATYGLGRQVGRPAMSLLTLSRYALYAGAAVSGVLAIGGALIIIRMCIRAR